MNKKKSNDNIDWSNHAESDLYTSEWIGAIIRYFSSFGKKKFNDLYNPNELKKNVLVGWMAKIITFLIFIYVVFKFST